MRRISDRLGVVFPVISLLLLVLPLSLGLLATLLPAFGYFPLAGKHEISLAPWRQLFSYEALWRSLALTVFTGWTAALLSLVSALWLLMHCYKTRYWRWLEKSLAPFLAIPHAAMAIALLFLLAPSGWFIRWVSPWLSGFNYPPLWQTTQDPWGLSLILALWFKELPFLLFVLLAACSQLAIKRSLMVGQSFGYSQQQVWQQILFPQLLRRIRLAFLCVLAFSLTVVDVAQIIGPSRPTTLALLVWQWFSDSYLENRLLGAAGALLLLGLVGVSLALALGLEKIYLRTNLARAMSGRRKQGRRSWLALWLLVVLMLCLVLSMVLLLIWSLAWRWRFPEALPSEWSLRYWQQASSYILEPLINSLSIAMASAALSLLLVVGCLEYQVKCKMSTGWWSLVIYLPLLLPQVAFLFGMQVELFRYRLDGLLISVIGAHLIFVLPYVYLTLVDSYRSFDRRYMQAAMSLSHSYWRSLFKVKLPMLTCPLGFAFAIGFAVSIAQYLPTLFVGAGRVSTLTTEAVALASGGDRRITAVMVIGQMVLPLLVYGAVIIWPKWRYRRRREMQN